MTVLNAQTLPELSSRLTVPGYDRQALRVGIVHFGVGGFHRAHQAMYLDRLLSRGLAQDWAICGVGVLPADRRMNEVLHRQDCLYTLVTKAPDGTRRAQVIGSIVDHLLVPDDPNAVIEKMADPAVRIVSLTVTEGGYNIHEVTGEFDVSNPAVVADLAPGAVPRSTFGLITEALARRKERGTPPFTVMSCDNMPGNGDVARRAVISFAELRDPALAQWIAESVSFPNSMVDRITPATTDEDRAELAEELGVEDEWPVVCEPFAQWVLENRFGLGRPAYEHVGVQMVDDVEPYELMKLRLLNAGHQAIAYFGYLIGYRYAHEAAGDPLLARFLLGYMRQEGIPTLPPVPGVDLDAYALELVERFANPGVRDTLARLCAFPSDRVPKFLLPVVRSQLASGGPIERSAAIVASWARYAEGIDEEGRAVEIVDNRAAQVTASARRQREDPLSFLKQRDLFGDLVDNDRFVTAYRRSLELLLEQGARATLVALEGTD